MPGWIMQLMESRYGDPVDDDDDDADGERFVDDHDDGSETVNTSNGDSSIKASRSKKKTQRPWYSSGVDISFNLEAEVAEKLSQEPLY